MKRVDVVISGIGGQGVLTLTSLLGRAAILEGYDVKISEVHGMAQRGGAVVCHVKIGKIVNSPLVMEGSADVLLSLELSETIRALNFLKPRGVVVMSKSAFPPPLSTIMGYRYPSLEEVIEELRGVAGEVYVVDAHEIARNIGAPLSANIVLLGAAWATGRLMLSGSSILKAINSAFKKEVAEMNVKTFEEGVRIVRKLL
ncbi:MAG: indolepyruvate oxidoreductase subunit beta [Candidatus Nezhaarchaeales archaeon]